MSHCTVVPACTFVKSRAKLIYVFSDFRSAWMRTCRRKASHATERLAALVWCHAMQPPECWYREQSIPPALPASHRQNRKQRKRSWAESQYSSWVVCFAYWGKGFLCYRENKEKTKALSLPSPHSLYLSLICCVFSVIVFPPTSTFVLLVNHDNSVALLMAMLVGMLVGPAL